MLRSLKDLDDCVVDDETWEVRYVVVQTSHLWFGKRVLVATRWANRISWEGEAIYVDPTRETITACPAWDATAPINREYDVQLYDYYGRPAYWSATPEQSPRAMPPGE
jgi:hypothetical protein